ncbi:MAG: nucleotidyl transferase AbiEii/AbiGii toxin family protein [Micrococcales bacterium]|nr:nucleotidyl transferase AbiEii/AbiGii toxin family protein [Micrococcales bacterium]
MADPLDLTRFRPEAAEKTTRLLVVLDRLRANPFLRPRLCLHGGTALNLFALGMPRLSVDIDLNYIGCADFAPDLLFADYPDTLAAAQVDPAAHWKMINLAKALGVPPLDVTARLGIGNGERRGLC